MAGRARPSAARSRPGCCDPSPRRTSCACLRDNRCVRELFHIGDLRALQYILHPPPKDLSCSHSKVVRPAGAALRHGAQGHAKRLPYPPAHRM
eukprot:scaffold28058_cov63-Phaeocystis_antarctica.AAC.3